MNINDLKRADELIDDLSEGLAMQQEIITSLTDAVHAYQEFLTNAIREIRDEANKIPAESNSGFESTSHDL